MNPDKLFDYLDGKLEEYERNELEQRLMEDPQLQRELEVARRIHAGMRATRTDRPEVLGELSEVTAARGRRLTKQVALAAMVLIGMNVLLGLIYIAHHESKNPNRALLEAQQREQLTKSLQKAAESSLTPPPIGIDELNVIAEKGRYLAMADEIVKVAERFGGSATKGVPEDSRIQIVAEKIPGSRAEEFRNALAQVAGAPNLTGDVSRVDQPISVIVHVSERK